MRIGVFSIISWSFLDQRPQVLAKAFARWGHETIYIETFDKFDHWHDDSPHPWGDYWNRAWQVKEVMPNLKVVNPLMIAPHKRFQKVFHKNEEFLIENKKRIKDLNLDLAVVIDPQWGRVLTELGIPFIYDHVDDTHHMSHVLKDFFYQEQKYSEEHAIFTLYIQPQIARRYHGLYVPNGIEKKELIRVPDAPKYYDAAVLSCIADWFDIDSVLASKRRILLMGPIEDDNVLKAYQNYRKKGGNHVHWVPRVTRRTGSYWLNFAKVGLIPFREDHGVVDYVMPLKIVEYYYLGMSAVSYVNKGVMDAFGDHVYSYSSTGWLGYPGLDAAIDQAALDDRVQERIALAEEFEWEKILAPLRGAVAKMEASQNLKGTKWVKSSILDEK